MNWDSYVIDQMESGMRSFRPVVFAGVSLSHAEIRDLLVRGRFQAERVSGQSGGMLFEPDPKTWSDPDVAGGGYGHAQLSHATGMLFWLTGLAPQSVYALMSAPDSRVDLYDALSVRFEGGAIGTVSGAGTVPPVGTAQYQVDIRIFGSEGLLMLDCERARLELRRHDGSLVDAQFSISLIDGKTVVVLTFAGSEFVGGSLADGRYTLTIRSDQVHDRFGRELDGDGDGVSGGDRVDGFFRLFGDSDGDGDVDQLDRDRFRFAFRTSAGVAGYLWYFDFDGDGVPNDFDPDRDDDGIENVADACDYTPLSYPPEQIEPDGTVLGDADGDCDVDLRDISIIQLRMSGPN